jgi:MarR family transcriptional regulator, organic hydroperoxide resistance regulator
MKADECIFFQLAKAGQLGSRFWGHKVSDLNVTPVQAMVLRFLYDQDQITSIDLGKKTELDSATLTGVIDRLENAGLIDRKDNPHDRRSIQIYLTEKGKITGEQVARRMEEANTDFLKAFTPQESGELRRLINTLRNQFLR